MSDKEKEKKEKKEKSESRDSDEGCCVVFDPCGCYYIDPCCAPVSRCCC